MLAVAAIYPVEVDIRLHSWQVSNLLPVCICLLNLHKEEIAWQNALKL